MKRSDFSREVLSRGAVVYVRQSTMAQLELNEESRRRQYALADQARHLGFGQVVVIDDDLGKSGSGSVERKGYQRLVAMVCAGEVGAVFCLEASRLARNGRDWHHLIELCGLVGTRVVDSDGVYDPTLPNDRLLLGLKGTMSEFELTLMRKRLHEALLAKAKRGELRISVPNGYVWPRDGKVEFDPDERIRAVIGMIFEKFDELGAARQVLMWLRDNDIEFPGHARQHGRMVLQWRLPSYRHVIGVLKNPFYAGIYAYGKSTTKVTVEGGKAKKSYKNRRSMADWTVFLQDHHPAYIDLDHFHRNQRVLAANSYVKGGGKPKAGRGGRALLSGLVRCRRCGRRMTVNYCGYKSRVVRYVCHHAHLSHGTALCQSFGGTRSDVVVANAVLAAVRPQAIEAAFHAYEASQQRADETARAKQLEVENAKYHVDLAERRYAAVDPANRLVASTLEQQWNEALEQLQAARARAVTEASQSVNCLPGQETLIGLAQDLQQVWQHAHDNPKLRQRLVRAAVEEIIADVDDETRVVELTIRWKGGHHSQISFTKPAPGEHTNRTGEASVAIIADMAGRWSDEHIAATLNRLGYRTGMGNSWTAQRVAALRNKRKIAAYASRRSDGEFVTMLEAQRILRISAHKMRRLIAAGLIPATQVVARAPWQIPAQALQAPEVHAFLEGRKTGQSGPCRSSGEDRQQVIPGTLDNGAA
jgi:DNA invertase Pin-like site-specific DNA recombinase